MSKQSTLGYVKSRQQTLGKFFGKPNGTASKAAPRQSTLVMKNAPEEKANTAVADKDEAEVNDEADVKMEESTAETPAKSPDDSGEIGARRSSLNGKRTIAEEEDSKSEDDSDEPPTKRQRKQAPKPVESKKPQPKKDSISPSPSKGSEGGRAAAQGAPKSPVKLAAAKVPQKAKDEDEAESTKSDSAAESEADSEGEEKPEVVAKAREKIQTVVKGGGKDPYPDWKAGDPVPYAALCATFSKVEMTTKRLEIMAHCSLFLQQVLRLTPGDLLPTILLMVNKLAADYSGIELGIGESLIMKAVGESTGRSLQVIKADQNEIGDLGLVAAKSRLNQPTMFKPKPLTVRGVHAGLMSIATVEGQGSQGRKIAGIKKLLSAADAESVGKGAKGVDITENKGGASEAKFIVRTLEGKLRLGLAEKTALVALAQAVVFHEITTANDGKKVPSTEQLAQGERTLKTVYSELPSYEVIIPMILQHGLGNLQDNCRLQPGVPLKPMLARPTKSITEVLDRFEGKDFTCEYKYDGERAQIHYVAHDAPQSFATDIPSAGKSVKGVANIFSRNSEDLSKKYPDILAKLPTWVKDTTKSFVLDCETVAWDVVEKKLLPFQQLMTRKRKDVKVEDVKVKVCVFAFDLLFLNGEALVKKTFRERREMLNEAFTPVEGEFSFATYKDTNELEEIQAILEESMKAACEGLMVKMLDGPESSYEPSKRSQNWLKVKKDYLAGVGDSLDLVVLGAYFGKGKRTSVYGAFLLACWNPSTEKYETVCNIGTGFSEAILEEFHTKLSEMVIEKAKPFYSHSAGNKDQPDVWFEPQMVWEVKTADLTLSPRYKAAAEEMAGGKGVSLRFPRFIRVRDDKKPDQATSSRMVAEMYRKQDASSKPKGPSVDDDFEY
ncbi:ATP-dependent DNA ligase [Eremomyces bilateralis CBS 781.70]|uniref:DNA ligase n=1 Tax=Eremomyces bilateralis CBS 781.70 TaxID=1392243 RepID=A0A6G1GG83_9PEZI|nr:ATP-dependent DNA ligase [Eremomyces bilateralis CBS 781.70]KAF1816921.1 ATP-dependent DNA ligase [Eremomyces bilateralis CBS 781.70]